MTTQFRFVRQLGSGGFGDLWLAEDTAARRLVVFKFLRDHDLDDVRRGFAREVKILLRRLHSGFIDILYHDLSAPRPYYVMPYAEGGTLLAWAGHLPVDNLIRIGVQLAEALRVLHASGIAHGDIKPDNVLVVDGHVKCSDPLGNGPGCTITFSTKCGGTHGYMAPEVANRWSCISPQGDAYSFGALLFHLVTGVHPVLFSQRGHLQLDVAAAGAVQDHPLRRVIWDLTAPDPRYRLSIGAARSYLASLHSPPSVAVCPSPSAATGSPIGWIAVALLAIAGLAAAAAAAKRSV